MKQWIWSAWIAGMVMFLGIAGCQASGTQEDTAPSADGSGDGVEEKRSEEQMKERTLTVDGQAFTIHMLDNETTRALSALLPLEVKMEDLHANEKFYYLPEALPVNAQSVGQIEAGDLMLYGSDCLVLFYESFPTSYRYTRLGKVENIDELAPLLGSGDVDVRVE